MCVSSNFPKEQSSRDSLGEIHGQDKNFYPRVKPLMSESGVQEIRIEPCLIVLFNILPCSVVF